MFARSDGIMLQTIVNYLENGIFNGLFAWFQW